MSNKNDKIIKILTPKRRHLRIAGIVVGILVFFQIGLYFGSDFLLRNYLKDKVKQVSENRYEIDFDRFYISLFQRGISFEGFSLIPVLDNLVNHPENPYYKISVQEISLFKLNYLFGKKEFQIGNLELRNPEIEFQLDTLALENQQISALQLFQEQIQKSFLGSSLNEIRIKNLHVAEADFLIKNFISQRAVKAENANLWMKDIQLLQFRIPETPFNAEGFEFAMEEFEILLADSVHTIQASEVDVSSLDQFIRAKNIKINPDFSKPSKDYFKVSLDELELEEADINRVFYTSEVDVGKLKLYKPDFELFSTKSAKNNENEVFDLYTLIEGLIGSISIKDLSIAEGKFIQRLVQDQDQYRIKTDRIDFEMSGVYIGPDESRKKDQFFYSQDASIDLYNVDLALADSIHWLFGEKVSLSSYEDAIRITGLKLSPLVTAEPDKIKTLFEIKVPDLNISDANLKKLYNQGILDIQEVVILRPEILLKDLLGKTQEQGSFDLKSITREFLEAIYIGRLEMVEGSLIVDNNLRLRQDSLSFGKVSFVLENFSLDESTGDSDSRSGFLAEDLQLELDDYALKLSDNLHVFKAGKLFLDTKRELVRIDGFSISPQNPGQIQPTLDRYGKSTAMDIFIPHFFAYGVDIPEAYFDGKLKVHQIHVPSPKINLSRYRTQKEEEGNNVDQRDILDLLRSYFNEVSVDTLILEKGTLNFENHVRDRMRTFSEENVSIAVKNFHIDEETNPEEFSVLFSDEVDLGLNNYVFSLANGKYNIVADRINFNSVREEIITSNVRLSPSGTYDDKTNISAFIPALSFKGVDLESFLFENTLNLTKVKLTGSSVKLLLNKDFEEEDSVATESERRDRELPKTIDVVRIDTVEAENASFNLSFREDGQEQELINTGINLSIFDFALDSAKLGTGDIASFFSGLSLGIDEFWLTLADSIHQITFSKVELDTRYEGILLNNFRVIPKNLSGQPGIPVFSAHIPRALIKTNSLSDLQFSRDLLIKEMRLFRPDIEMFVDEESIEPKEKSLEDITKNIIEKLVIEEFEIMEGNFAILDKNSSKEAKEFKNLNLSFNQMEFDLTDLAGLERKDFLDKDFNLSLPNYEIRMEDGLNKVSVGLITLNNNNLKLQNVRFSPLFGKYQYSRMVGSQTDVIDLTLPEVMVYNVDLDRFLELNEFSANKVELNGFHANVFRDKRFPIPKDQYRFMPQELFMNADWVMQIDTLQLKNGSIQYTEFPEKGMVPGNITFTELEAMFHPVIFHKKEMDYPVDSANITARALLNGKAQIDLSGIVFFKSPFPMDLKAEIGAFDLDILNTILEPNAFATVTAGKVNGANWSFTANNEFAKGEMIFLYEDLKLTLLDERTLEKARGRRGMLTFVLNTFAVKSNNPRKQFKNTISSNIYEPRDKQKFIFNYWWKTTLSGIKGSLGLGQSKPPSLLKR